MANSNILIVEDENLLRETMKTILEDKGFNVFEATNGKEAKDTIACGSFDLVVSDIQMPHWTGIELLEWVRNVYEPSTQREEKLPFIIITGFAHLKETKRVFDFGVEHLIKKPFDGSFFLETIQEMLKEEEVEKPLPIMKQQEFCRVSLEDFVSEKNVMMDVYIHLGNGKYIKLIHKGGKLISNRISLFKSKGVEHLYVRQEDFHKVLNFNINLVKSVSSSKSINRKKKQRFISYTADLILENTFVNGVDRSVYHDTMNFFNSSLDVLTDNEETLELLEILNSHSEHLYAHSLGVSIYSIMIGKSLHWNSSRILFLLGFGGLMHDIGKKEIDRDLLFKPRPLLSLEERKFLESHTLRGKEILESVPSVPSEVVAIAYEHHENSLGQGYPRQLNKHQIHPLAKVTAVAEEFCLYALKSPSASGMSARKAIDTIDQFKKDILDHKTYMALKSLIR